MIIGTSLWRTALIPDKKMPLRAMSVTKRYTDGAEISVSVAILRSISHFQSPKALNIVRATQG